MLPLNYPHRTHAPPLDLPTIDTCSPPSQIHSKVRKPPSALLELRNPSLNKPDTQPPLAITQQRRLPPQLPRNEAPLSVFTARPYQRCVGFPFVGEHNPWWLAQIGFEGINETVIAASTSGKKSANWTNRDDEKLLDILIEQRAQGAVKFEWSLVRVMLKNERINKESIQIKNHCNDLRKKLGAWEFLIGKIGVGVDYKTGAVVMSDSTWQDFLQRYGWKCKSFRKKVPANLEKMKSAFYGKQATGEMSFAPGMVVSPSNQTQRSTGKARDMDKHIGDSDEANEDGLMLIWNAFLRRKVNLLLRVCTALASEKVKAGLLVTANGKSFLTGHQEMRRCTKPFLLSASGRRQSNNHPLRSRCRHD
ncbi:hypothetical protein Cgig2_021052 [Carnegiea gigantea]|uniref:Myb/SANT-like domain-containing protein n=1 Tax=Carnegiea gigantea TaxID=171969 RepID=A0A9Q1JQ06_9CARY|nr:hypothetical protein Cgig2_021052 [Carnegiea gigantea]